MKPIVYDFPRTADFLKFMDQYGIERSLVMSNYGIPKPEQPLLAEPRGHGAAISTDRIRGLLWVSFRRATASTRWSRPSATAARPASSA